MATDEIRGLVCSSDWTERIPIVDRWLDETDMVQLMLSSCVQSSWQD